MVREWRRGLTERAERGWPWSAERKKRSVAVGSREFLTRDRRRKSEMAGSGRRWRREAAGRERKWGEVERRAWRWERRWE